MNPLSIHWMPTPTAALASCKTTLACSPFFAVHALQSFFLFLILGGVAWVLINNLRLFKTQSVNSRLQLTAYAMSAVHHSCVVPAVGWSIAIHSTTGSPPYPVISVALAFFIGYIVAELCVYIVPSRDWVFAVHHALVLILIVGLLNSSAILLRWVPVYLVCEASSFGLMISYVLKKLGRSASVLAVLANVYFVGSFFLLRIVNLGATTIALLTGPLLAPDRAALGLLGQISIAALWLLQVYWLRAIVVALTQMIRGKKG